MFDTMTLTKILAGVCGSLLIFLFGAWAASSIYGLGHVSHGEEHALSYSVEGAEAEAEPAEAEVEVPFAEKFAMADAAAGEKVFGKCKACHSIEGKDGVGPHLNGVVGRDHAAISGFGYSDAMAGKAGTPWSEEELYNFIKNPKKWMPGTKMSFAGLPKAEDRVDVIAYLATLK
jgi:cytochrome c